MGGERPHAERDRSVRSGGRARCLRRRPDRLGRRQPAPRRRAGRDRRPEGGLAPRRDRRRRQDRRRCWHPRRDPTGLLPRAHRRRRPQAGPGARRRGHDVPAAHRSGRPGALPCDRRAGDSEVRLHHLRLAPGPGEHRGDRREGERDPAGDRADHDLQRPRALGRRLRPGPLRHPPADREGGRGRVDQGLLLLLPVLPVDHLQGHVPGRAADLLLSRPGG